MVTIAHIGSAHDDAELEAAGASADGGSFAVVGRQAYWLALMRSPRPVPVPATVGRHLPRHGEDRLAAGRRSRCTTLRLQAQGDLLPVCQGQPSDWAPSRSGDRPLFIPRQATLIGQRLDGAPSACVPDKLTSGEQEAFLKTPPTGSKQTCIARNPPEPAWLPSAVTGRLSG